MSQQETYKEFYNKEISAIADIKGTSKEIIIEVKKRVLEYGEQIHSLHARQAAGLNYIQQLKHDLEEKDREELHLQDLLYKPQAPKAPRSTKKVTTEAQKSTALKSLAKTFGWTTKTGEWDIERVQKFVDDNK